MGVEARLVLYAPDEPTAMAAAADAFARLEQLDAVMSDYRDDSELMRLCDHAGEGPRPASDDLVDVLTLGRDIAERSGGAFDPTVGPVVALWRQARRDHAMPDPDDLRHALDLVDYRAVRIDHDARTVELARPGIRLDLGAIGKGFAADEAVQTLEAHDITACLVDLGGDITLADPPPGRDAWSVTVEHGDGTTLRLRLANRAIATSGDTVQFVEIDGVRYSHIVDPRTGLGLTNRTAATVIAPSGALADAYASVACVLGATEGVALIDTLSGVECLVTSRTPEGLESAASAGFPRESDP